MILAAISVNGSMSVADLVRVAQASSVTVRRDLEALERLGQIERQRGGARAVRGAIDEPTYHDKHAVALDEKAAIADLAAGLIEDGSTIMLSAGTTTEHLADRIRDRRLVVVTNSMRVAETLADADDVEVFVLGGVLRGSIRAVVGGAAEQALASFRFTTVVMSGNGLTPARGLSTPNLHVASLDRLAARMADRVIVLADATKVGVDALVQTVPTSDIDLLVTSDAVPPATLEAFAESGVVVHVAKTLPMLDERAVDGE